MQENQTGTYIDLCAEVKKGETHSKKILEGWNKIKPNHKKEIETWLTIIKLYFIEHCYSTPSF